MNLYSLDTYCRLNFACKNGPETLPEAASKKQYYYGRGIAPLPRRKLRSIRAYNHMTFRAAIQGIEQACGAGRCGALLVWNATAHTFQVAGAFGCPPDALGELGLHARASVVGQAFEHATMQRLVEPDEIRAGLGSLRPVLARALRTDALPLDVLALPLYADNYALGVLLLTASQRPFDAAEQRWLAVAADLLALALHQARPTSGSAAPGERARAEMMGMLSHELRTPLAAIKGYATALLLDEVEWDDEQRRAFLGLINQECDALESMVREMLDASLIDVGQLRLEHQPVRLPRVAGEIAEEMQQRTHLHRLIVDFPPDFPLIEADPRWIRQIFRNILENALKYSPDGGMILIKGDVRADDVVISIADQGIGISPEDLVPLFEKYFRASRLDVAGTGLGLPVVRALVEAHGGRIWAESQVNYGTTFYFSLPVGEL